MMTISSSSGEMDADGNGNGNGKEKRKLGDCLDGLMREVLEKQEELHNKFMAALEKCDKDRIAREEAWKTQELARLKREQEMLAQERAISATRDAAVIAFFQRISNQEAATTLQLPLEEGSLSLLKGQGSGHGQGQNIPTPIPFPTPPPPPPPIRISTPVPFLPDKVFAEQKNGIAKNSNKASSSSRWLKPEVEALIRLRTSVDMKYQDNGPNGLPLWEEISSSMMKLGYNRNAKRCKEKWENMNKYFKRVRHSNKIRPQDSKTCPYYNLLYSLHETKCNNKFCNSDSSDIMQQQPQKIELVTEDGEISEKMDQNQEDDKDEENGDDFQIVGNKPSSITNSE